MLTADHLFAKYYARIQIRDRILGGIPTTDEVGKIVHRLSPGAPVEERQKLAEDKILESTCTFLFDEAEGQYYLRDSNIVSMLREAADVLQLAYTSRQLLQHGTVVKPARIYLGKELAAETLRRPIHVEVRGVGQSTVKVNQYIEKPELAFEIWVGLGRGKSKRVKGGTKHIPDTRLTKDDVRDLLLTATEVGLGACRAQQWGKFDLVEFGELS